MLYCEHAWSCGAGAAAHSPGRVGGVSGQLAGSFSSTDARPGHLAGCAPQSRLSRPGQDLRQRPDLQSEETG